MECPKVYTTDQHPPGLRSLRRTSGEYGEPQLLRRRTGSRIDSPAHLDHGHFFDEFRNHAPVLGPCSYGTVGTNAHCKLGDYARPSGLFDPPPLTPLMVDSDTVASACLQTPIEFSEAQDYCQIPRDSAEVFRAASDGLSYSIVSAESATTIVAPLARISRTGTKLGEWPKPSPLNAPDTGSSLGDSDLTETDIRKSVDAASLESGPGGVLGLGWFDRWTNFKWCLLFSVLSVSVYGIIGLICAIMTWFQIWQNADVMFVADNDILILLTLASSLLIFTALTGLAGILLSSRPILAFYALLLWPCFIAMCATGYIAYKRSTFALEPKLDMSWSQSYKPLGRLMIQNSLQCCGWSDPLHGGTPSKTCYPRTSLPGCKGPLLRFEQANLRLVWTTVFSLVPLHIINILVVMLCASHVTRNLGVGITPERYCSAVKDVNLLMEQGGVRMRGVKRPGIVRDHMNGVIREDSEERVGLLEAYFDEVEQR